MKITPDTNVLLRLMLQDDEGQQVLAMQAMSGAEMVAVFVDSLCEFVWVLERTYKVASAEIAAAIRRLLNTHNVVVNRSAVEAGLSMLEAGSDFADGIIAQDGDRLGGETFVSFDRKAVSLMQQQGRPAMLLV